MLNLHKKLKDKKDSLHNPLQNPKILEVNLVKNERNKFFDWHKSFLSLIIVLSLASLFFLEIYFGLNWWQNIEQTRATVFQTQITKINNQIISLKNKNQAALNYKVKSEAFSKILNQHVYWTNFFSWLEKNTLSTVKYTGFKGDLNGHYTLSALAPNYADVSWQVKAFLNDPLTQKVSVLQAHSIKNTDKTKPSQVSFDLLLQVNPHIFSK